MLESLLRRDRHIVGAGIALIAVLCWVYLVAGAGMGADGIAMTRMSYVDPAEMPGMTPPAWTVGYATLMFAMWWVMMAAMMLPAAAPTILLAAAVNRRAEPDRAPFGSVAAFAAGYLGAWAIFSALAVMAQWGLQRVDAISVMLRATSDALAAALLIGAGAWQLSRFKGACLRHCRSPAQWLTAPRRRGDPGAFETGLLHGAYCLGCCWILMTLLFVGGVMNLFWIAGLSVAVLAEKLAPRGIGVARAIGVGLLLIGGARLAGIIVG